MTICDIDDLLNSKLEWCSGFIIWDRYAEQFLFAEESCNDPYDEGDYDGGSEPIVERLAFNVWTADVTDMEVEDGFTTLTLNGDEGCGGFACPESDMPMNEFLTLACSLCGESYGRNLTDDECYERFDLIKFYASSVFVEMNKQKE